MRTLLVRTSPPGALEQGYASPLVCQPIGALQIAACIRESRRGDVVKVVDAAVQLREADLGPLVEEFRPDVIGLSGLSLEEPVVRRMVGSVQGRTLVVAGGPMATAGPERMLAIEGVDLACVGEGEVTLPRILDAVDGGRDPGRVWGVASRDGRGRARSGRVRSFVKDLDGLPPIDYGDIEIDLYSRVNNFSDLPPMADRYVSILTSRGCPYRCTFCHGMMGRKVRAWSIERIVDEMQRLSVDHGVGEIHIVDDIFNYRRGRIRRLCAEIRRRGLEIFLAFPNGLRGDRIEPGDMEDLASVGCVSMSLAVESVSPRILAMVRKDIDVERVLWAAGEARKAGIFTRGYIMLGFPTETREEMDLTIRRMRQSAFDTVYVQPVIPYPGTPLFDLAVMNGFRPEDHFGYAYDYRGGGDINASPVPDDDFRRLLREAGDWIHDEPARRRSMRAFWKRHPRRDSPSFRTQGQWKHVVDGWTGAVRDPRGS